MHPIYSGRSALSYRPLQIGHTFFMAMQFELRPAGAVGHEIHRDHDLVVAGRDGRCGRQARRDILEETFSLPVGGRAGNRCGYSEEVPESIRPLLRLSREMIVRCQKTEYALVSSLQRDPLLAERIKRLRTVPGVGPIAALTWALEIGDVSRFRSIKQAISYCGLYGEEKSSADKVLRTPLSKQRSKHIQHVLVEAAKLAPRQSPELALLHEPNSRKGTRIARRCL
jgi:transposase